MSHVAGENDLPDFGLPGDAASGVNPDTARGLREQLDNWDRGDRTLNQKLLALAGAVARSQELMKAIDPLVKLVLARVVAGLAPDPEPEEPAEEPAVEEPTE